MRTKKHLYPLNLCDERIIELFGHPIKQLNKDYIDLIFKKYPGNDYFREDLTYCKRCLNKGYHSILHQFKLVHYCPFHINAKLNNRCPQCKITIPYRLNDDCSGFRCKCGYTFFKDNAHFHVIWKEYQPRIVSPVIERWVSLNDQNQKELDRIILFSEINPDKVPNMMERLLSMIDLDHESTVKDKHFIIKSHSNLYKQGKRLQHYKKAYDSLDERALERIERKVNEEIYDSSVNTFTAICSKLLKTILKKHRTCIERIDIDKEICPYAYAYLHWRHCVEGLGKHWRVCSRFFRKKPTHLYYQLDTISAQDQYVLHRLISNWEDRKNRNRKYESVAATKWVINRVIHFIIMNHFKNWLEFDW
ncbi:hypothetical protein GK047_28645 [Paenibacillus sp. SYP-B3998]|uniref:TniQ family protein n=1 Tax=Paenibacillus sp. SYP-B3998 TaxID=2678564 RepID=A0A6G4A5X5_9BACL|nr:hypothetical protein [Paenibacillus sp. SYP-B3998]NEW09873.1 hypothetical protein [Paenibacillus sp. SYP-B3998]